MRLMVLIFLCGLGLSAMAQPFAIGRQTITLTDPARSNRSIPSEIFYPATSAGNNTPVATGVFPVIVFGHGFSMNYDAYTNFWNEFVPQGYILAFPKTEVGPIPFPSHGTFALDMSYTITWFIAENTTPASRYYQKVNGKFAVMGHSMGGGCSFLAAATDPNVTVIANFAAAETNPSAIAAAANITVPALIFAGSKDCVAGPAANQTLMFNDLASVCKSYVNITDGSHCQFGESNTLCNFGESSSCFGATYISRSAQHAKTFEYLNPFLSFYLKGDCDAWPVYQGLLAAPTGAVVQYTCNYQLPTAAITAIGNLHLCAGDTVILQANSNTAYQWTGGSTQQQLTVTQGGTYQLVVSDNIGCTDTASQAITQSLMQVQASITDANCGSSDGEATLSVSGGITPYRFLWPSGDTTNALTGLAGGNYVVTVTDDENCQLEYTVSISAPGSLVVSIATAMASCPGSTDGEAVATVSGGTPPYSYQWQGLPTATTDTASGYGAGNYVLTITDFNGCILMDSFEVEEPFLPSPTIVSLTGTMLCEDDTAELVTMGTYPTYLWSTGDTTAALKATLPGFYNCTVTDANGCTITGVGVNIVFYQNYMDPEILLEGDSLYISEGTVMAWYRDGETVTGATGNYILNPEDGGYYAHVTDSNGCDYLAKSYAVTALGDLVWAAQIKVYPNPAHGMLVVEGLPTDAQISIIDMLGRVYSLEISSMLNGSVQLSIGHLPQQMYLLQVVSGESRYICKVFISR